MLERLFVTAIVVGMLGSVGLLIDICVVNLILAMVPLLAFACLLSVISLAIYFVSNSPTFRRVALVRWSA